MKATKSGPAWKDVKASLASADRAALLALLQVLYESSKENQQFLHVRLRLLGDPSALARAEIERWLRPDWKSRKQQFSIANAKKALSGYRGAAGDRAGIAELTVFFCECLVATAREVGVDDEKFADSIVANYGQALKAVHALAADSREAAMTRLRVLLDQVQDVGYGMPDQMWDLFAQYGGFDGEEEEGVGDQPDPKRES